jgi:hypothetical protein
MGYPVIRLKLLSSHYYFANTIIFHGDHFSLINKKYSLKNEEFIYYYMYIKLPKSLLTLSKFKFRTVLTMSKAMLTEPVC